MASITLRVRGPSCQATLAGLSTDMPVAEFLTMLADKTGVAVGSQEIMAGFPPKIVELPSGEAQGCVLSSLPFTNGDSLTVRQVAGQAPAPQPASDTFVTTSNGPITSQPKPQPASSTVMPSLLNSVQTYGGSNTHDDDPELAAAISASLAEAASAHPTAAVADAAARPTTSLHSSQAQVRQQEHSYSHPATSPSEATPAASGGAPAPTQVAMPDGSAVARRVVASDNSCLFNAVGYVMEASRARAPVLRQLIASTVASDPFTYNDGFLGMSNEEYCKWIVQPDKWGGAIELSILCSHYGREIAAYDIQTQRCDVYGQDAGYTERVMLIYDGLHYDALAVAAFDGAPEELDITIYEPASSTAQHIQAAAAKLVEACSKARQFTNTATFTLRCGVCQIGLKGEKEAVAHAKATGHQNFTEY